jgi:hypothetical protein
VSAGKWSIAKRDTAADGWAGWPWLLTYPDGVTTCLCFSFECAVNTLKNSQRSMRFAKGELDRQLRRSAAGRVRQEVLSRA